MLLPEQVELIGIGSIVCLTTGIHRAVDAADGIDSL